jgi:hypothetical protein
VWDDHSAFGHRKPDSRESLTEAYLELPEEQVKPWIGRGRSAAIYTPTTDVETEVNGFLTHDRAVEKMDVERLADANRNLT